MTPVSFEVLPGELALLFYYCERCGGGFSTNTHTRRSHCCDKGRIPRQYRNVELIGCLGQCVRTVLAQRGVTRVSQLRALSAAQREEVLAETTALAVARVTQLQNSSAGHDSGTRLCSGNPLELVRPSIEAVLGFSPAQYHTAVFQGFDMQFAGGSNFTGTARCDTPPGEHGAVPQSNSKRKRKQRTADDDFIVGDFVVSDDDDLPDLDNLTSAYGMSPFQLGDLAPPAGGEVQEDEDIESGWASDDAEELPRAAAAAGSAGTDNLRIHSNMKARQVSRVSKVPLEVQKVVAATNAAIGPTGGASPRQRMSSLPAAGAAANPVSTSQRHPLPSFLKPRQKAKQQTAQPPKRQRQQQQQQQFSRQQPPSRTPTPMGLQQVLPRSTSLPQQQPAAVTEPQLPVGSSDMPQHCRGMQQQQQMAAAGDHLQASRVRALQQLGNLHAHAAPVASAPLPALPAQVKDAAQHISVATAGGDIVRGLNNSSGGPSTPAAAGCTQKSAQLEQPQQIEWQQSLALQQPKSSGAEEVAERVLLLLQSQLPSMLSSAVESAVAHRLPAMEQAVTDRVAAAMQQRMQQHTPATVALLQQSPATAALMQHQPSLTGMGRLSDMTQQSAAIMGTALNYLLSVQQAVSRSVQQPQSPWSVGQEQTAHAAASQLGGSLAVPSASAPARSAVFAPTGGAEHSPAAIAGVQNALQHSSAAAAMQHPPTFTGVPRQLDMLHQTPMSMSTALNFLLGGQQATGRSVQQLQTPQQRSGAVVSQTLTDQQTQLLQHFSRGEWQSNSASLAAHLGNAGMGLGNCSNTAAFAAVDSEPLQEQPDQTRHHLQMAGPSLVNTGHTRVVHGGSGGNRQSADCGGRDRHCGSGGGVVVGGVVAGAAGLRTSSASEAAPAATGVAHGGPGGSGGAAGGEGGARCDGGSRGVLDGSRAAGAVGAAASSAAAAAAATGAPRCSRGSASAGGGSGGRRSRTGASAQVAASGNAAGGAPAAAGFYRPPGGVAGHVLHAAVPNFHGCAHGVDCMRCLAGEVLYRGYGVRLDFPISIPEEPWLQQLGQLDDDQLFAVAVVLSAITKYQAAKSAGPVEPPHLNVHATSGCGKSTVVNVIKFLCDKLGYANVETSCFSNRLLARLHKATTTIEAMMGVAFKYEPHINAQLAGAGSTGFLPSYNWFFQMWLKDSKLQEAINKGLEVMLFDEAWTLHPLIHEYFVRFLDEHGVISVGAGEVLQVGPKLDSKWLTKRWHTEHAFQMPYWQRLQQAGRVIFLRLTTNHRLPANQFNMLKRMSLGEAAVTDQDLRFLSSLGDKFPPGVWFMTLVFNKQEVARYNKEKLQQLQGCQYRVALQASVKDSADPMLQNLSVQERARLCRQGKAEVLSRLHQQFVDEHGDGALAQLASLHDNDLTLGLKPQMPVLFSQRCGAPVWTLSNGVWNTTGAGRQLQAGDLGVVIAVFSTNPAEVQQMNNPVQQAAGVRVSVMSAVVLVQLEGPQGPVVSVPVANHEVPLIEQRGIVWVSVNYLPIRIGWCTTVTATQGLEFERVLLDLNNADWLPGGGYTGVGRVKGDLLQGLRIKDGFHSVASMQSLAIMWQLPSGAAFDHDIALSLWGL